MSRRSASCSVIWLFGFSVLAAERINYWVEPCTRPQAACQADDPQLAQWAFEAWQRSSEGRLQFALLNSREHARIRLYWASAEQGMYGEARPIQVDGKKGADVYVRPAPLSVSDDKLLRDTIVYLTCLHETGHALGLPHTASFDDIMYSFQYGGDIPEYFNRYRRKLAKREDIRNNFAISQADHEALNRTTDKPNNR